MYEGHLREAAEPRSEARFGDNFRNQLQGLLTNPETRQFFMRSPNENLAHLMGTEGGHFQIPNYWGSHGGLSARSILEEGEYGGHHHGGHGHCHGGGGGEGIAGGTGYGGGGIIPGLGGDGGGGVVGGGGGGVGNVGGDGGGGVGGIGGGTANPGDINAINSLVQFQGGTDPTLNQQILQTIDNLPASTRQAILQDRPQIIVEAGGAQDGAAAYFDPSNNEVHIFEGTGEELEATVHEMFHVQDAVQNLTGAFGNNPTAANIAEADIARMSPQQRQQLAQLEPFLPDEPAISDGMGGSVGLGDIAAEIATGLEGFDQTGEASELSQLFPQLTQYLEQQIA